MKTLRIRKLPSLSFALWLYCLSPQPSSFLGWPYTRCWLQKKKHATKQLHGKSFTKSYVGPILQKSKATRAVLNLTIPLERIPLTEMAEYISLNWIIKKAYRKYVTPTAYLITRNGKTALEHDSIHLFHRLLNQPVVMALSRGEKELWWLPVTTHFRWVNVSMINHLFSVGF